jgi:hypothetical protein
MTSLTAAEEEKKKTEIDGQKKQGKSTHQESRQSNSC